MSSTINLTCQCGKSYKTQHWYNKHVAKCNTSTQQQEQPEQQPEQQQPEQPKPYLKVSKELDADFYYTIKSKKNAGVDYASPQDEAINNNKSSDVVLCKEKDLKQGRTGKSYGVMPVNKLNEVYTNNHHLYELLGEERKLYLDVEFPDLGSDENRQVMLRVLALVIKCFRDINIEPDGDFLISQVQGTGETGTFKGIKKMSYHIIVDNGYVFKSLDDIRLFRSYMFEKAQKNVLFKSLFQNTGFVIDMNVYTKNRLFKLPYQSKVGSIRVHTPKRNSHKNLHVKKWLVGVYGDDVKYYDVSNLKVVGMIENKRVLGRDGREYHGEAWKLDTLKEYIQELPNNTIINKKVQSLEDLVMSIYNGKEIKSYQVFTAVGMAIHRATQGSQDGLKLWKKWVDKYEDTPISILNTQYEGFDFNKGYGYSTLKMLASQCNPQVRDNDKTECLFTFDTDITTKTFNERYIKDDVYDLDNYDTIYVKSPMGTGKSYQLHKVFNSKRQRVKDVFYLEDSDTPKYPKILYLSSRRAFACSMADEFHDDGFKNYLDNDFTGYEARIIISPESLFKLKSNTFDLIVVDESESIFKIISSPTLQNEYFKTNADRLMTLLKNSNKVVIMDAFLQQRSIDAVNMLRNNTKQIIHINNYKQEAKELINYDSRDKMLDELKKKLTNGKKCVFVCGNRELAKSFISGLDANIKVQFYSRDNKLPNRVDVNQLWNCCDLLVYTPTITCGISFTVEHFDELFMYISNVGSCIPRDLIQASRRVRKFKDNKVHFCLTYNSIGLDDELMPMDAKEIESNIIGVKRSLFDNQDNNANDWLLKSHIHNLVEEHISRRQTHNVFKRLFEEENINNFEIKAKVKTSKLSCDISTSYDDVKNINNSTYNQLIHKMNSEGLSSDEYNTVFKYKLMRTFDNDDKVFNAYSLGLDYDIKQKRQQLNNIIIEHNYIDDIERIKENVGVNEFERMTKKQLHHIKNIKNALNITKYDTTITNQDLLKVQDMFNVENYLQTLRVVFNTTFKVDKVEKPEHIKIVLNAILKQWNGYQLTPDKRRSVRINGKHTKVQEYKFKSTTDINVYNMFKEEVIYDLD